MQQHNHRLLGHCKRLERQKDVVMAQVRAMQDKWGEAEATRVHLQNEVDTLRKTLEARCRPSMACQGLFRCSIEIVRRPSTRRVTAVR